MNGKQWYYVTPCVDRHREELGQRKAMAGLAVRIPNRNQSPALETQQSKLGYSF